MAWRDQIRPASFRGAPFGVSGDDKEAGRRTVLHEFPQREEAYVEDLGAAAARFTVQAFVLGPDYLDKRDALEKALAEPGPGTLVHPWYGEIIVSQAAPYKVRHAAQDGGLAVFTLSFARDAAPSSPAAGVNPKIRSLDKSGLAGLLSCSAFDSAFKVAGQTAQVVNQAYKDVTAAVRRVQAVLGGDVGAIAGLLGAATGYDFIPLASVGQSLWRVFQGLGDDALARGWTQTRLAAAWQQAASLEIAAGAAVPNPGGTRARIAGNETAVNVFARHLAAAESARALTLAAPESRAQAQELREGFVDALDLILEEEAGEEAPTGLTRSVLPGDLYVAFADMRAAALAALAEAARSAPDITEHTPAAVLPALTLCYRLSGGIGLEADLVARNRVIHPGFVPVQRLEVLTYE